MTAQARAAKAVGDVTNDLIEARSGPVAILTINRPERRNALTAHVLDGLLTSLHRLERDPEVRALVLTGSGGAFSSGADLKSDAIGAKRLLLEHYNPVVTALLQSDLPVVAAVDGVAAGAGVSLALACDLRVAGPDAYFQLSFAKVGLIPDAGLTWLLPRLLGGARAAELALLARDLPADEARAWGLVTQVSEPGRCLAEAVALGERLGALSSSTGSIKRALRRGAEADLQDHLSYEAEMQHRMQGRPDFHEALEAFRERRQPVFGPRPVPGS